jgi:N-carbamoyl-L-amino-acid hydrolase
MSAPSTPRNLDTERLWRELMALGEITEPSLPYTRRSFSPMYDEGRAFLKIQMRAAGLKVRVDEGGNLIGRLEGADPTLPAIVLGSHSDTVPAGGRFDGVAGVVAALEVVRTLAESGEALRRVLHRESCDRGDVARRDAGDDRRAGSHPRRRGAGCGGRPRAHCGREAVGHRRLP